MTLEWLCGTLGHILPITITAWSSSVGDVRPRWRQESHPGQLVAARTRTVDVDLLVGQPKHGNSPAMTGWGLDHWEAVIPTGPTCC